MYANAHQGLRKQVSKNAVDRCKLKLPCKPAYVRCCDHDDTTNRTHTCMPMHIRVYENKSKNAVDRCKLKLPCKPAYVRCCDHDDTTNRTHTCTPMHIRVYENSRYKKKQKALGGKNCRLQPCHVAMHMRVYKRNLYK